MTDHSSQAIRGILASAGLPENEVCSVIEKIQKLLELKVYFEKGSNPQFFITLKGDTMNESTDKSKRSVGNVVGNRNLIQAGDENIGEINQQSTSFPYPAGVDINAVFRSLGELLQTLETPEKNKIVNAMKDIDDELSRREPDKEEIGGALQRALKYAKKAANFAENLDELKTHVVNAAAWLGERWHELTNIFS